MQERALKLALSGDDCDDGALAHVTAQLANAKDLPRDSLLDFAARFEAKGLYANAVQAFLGARLPLECAFAWRVHVCKSSARICMLSARLPVECATRTVE